SVTSADAADYAVTVTSAVGSTTSRFARLVVASPEPGRLINLSARATAGVAGEPLIVGLVVSGGTRKVLVRAIGPSLRTLFGVDGVLADPRLEVHRSVDGQDQMLAANDNWAATPEERDSLATTFARVGAFAVPATSRDAAVVADVDGARTFHACAVPASDRGVVLVEVYDAGTGDSPRLINLSTRNQVGTGDDVLVAGFVVNGNMPKRLLVRGIGPSLASGFGVTDALPDARLELHTTIDGRDTIVASNDDWTDEPGAAEAAASAGAFALPANSKDATLVVTVPAGAYTAIVSGAYGLTGNGLVEIYELP
ncbi:MAG TPA: hypothetical protein VHE61_07955, partial [Opitutaceae bacterium]|nr:hypothetical protein [Opitutaceae bacterium]